MFLCTEMTKDLIATDEGRSSGGRGSEKVVFQKTAVKKNRDRAEKKGQGGMAAEHVLILNRHYLALQLLCMFPNFLPVHGVSV